MRNDTSTRIWKPLGGMVIFLFGSGALLAQGPAIAYPSNNWTFTHHSSTAAEGALRGHASVLNALGELYYLNSLAAVNYQEAQRRAIDNSVAYTKAYFEKREMQEEFLRRYGRKPLVGEARKKYIAYYMPKKLTATEFNAETGQITWPHILRQPQYAPIKNEIDKVFASRNKENSGDGSSTQLQINQMVKSLTSLLRENIDTMSSEQYMHALEFLRSVDAEAKNAVAVSQPDAAVSAPVKEGGVPGADVKTQAQRTLVPQDGAKRG